MMTLREVLDPALRLRLRQQAVRAGLTPSMRRAVIRLQWHGLSEPEIAEALGLPLARVRALLEGPT